MMSPSNPLRDAMANGISIRVRVRRAPSTAKLEYGESMDMVCTIVNCDSHQTPAVAAAAARQQQSRRKGRKKSSSKSHIVGGPTLYFNARAAHQGHTLEACCSLNSISSFDSSLDPSIISETEKTDEEKKIEPSPVGEMVETIRNRSRQQKQQQQNDINNIHQKEQQQQQNNIKKSFAIPCSSIKTVEKISSLFRGYRIFFATGSRGAVELEFENRNGSDIMMAFLQASLPGERFVNNNNTSNNNGGSVDGSDTASYLSTLDLEKLTERLAEREARSETMSEKIRNGVGKVVYRLEEMSSSFCGGVCCSGQSFMTSSVAPYNPSLFDTPDKTNSQLQSNPTKQQTTSSYPHSASSPFLGGGGGFAEPVMEIDEEEEKSTTQQDSSSEVLPSSKDFDALRKRRYLKEYQLPSGLSVEMPPEDTSKYRLSSV